MSQANCKNCKERYPGCHDNCDIYQAFKNKSKELSGKQKKYTDLFNFENRLKKSYGKGW